MESNKSFGFHREFHDCPDSFDRVSLDRRKLKLILRNVHNVHIGDAVMLTVTNTECRPIKVEDTG